VQRRAAPNLIVRTARPDELPLIDEIFLASARKGWRSTFGVDRLETLSEAGLPEWELDRVSVLVAVSDSELVGFASFGPAYGEEEQDPATGKLYRLFVHPASWRAGVGGRLLASSTDALRDAGFRGAVLWVGSANSRARQFYERRGWKLDGHKRVRPFLGTDYREVRYRLALHVLTRSH
jgi:GNAT superfamily N-acetyltransferase